MTRTLTAIAVAAALYIPSSALAQSQHSRCHLYDRVIGGLKKGYDEEPRVMALDGQGSSLVFLTSPTGTWTAYRLVRRAGQVLACELASGTAWSELERAPVGEPA